MITKQVNLETPLFFEQFILHHKLDPLISDQLWLYASLIIEWNEKFNLTSKTKIASIVRDLFDDSLAFLKFFSLENIKSIADAGTGAGIPGLVLKITNPNLKLILIEVNGKKRDFLEYVAQRLSLDNVTISGLDWRTFNRKTSYEIDCFVTKAAFSGPEIIRMFRNNCSYKDKELVYWASSTWIADKHTSPYIKNTFQYTSGGRKSQLVLFSNIIPK